jgi:hypothetical protein
MKDTLKSGSTHPLILPPPGQTIKRKGIKKFYVYNLYYIKITQQTPFKNGDKPITKYSRLEL